MENMESMLSHVPGKILIDVIGLSDYEMRLLRSVFSLTTTRGRAHSYALHDANGVETADIILLDPENAQAQATLQTLQKQSASLPVVLYITNNTPGTNAKNVLMRPLAPTKLLALLDQIADKMPARATVSVPGQVQGQTRQVQPAAGTAAHPAVNSASSSASNPAAHSASIPVSAAMPAAQAAAKPVAAVKNEVRAEPPAFLARPAFRALVVDDSPTVRIKIEQELRPAGVVTDCVESGEQALMMLQKQEYDLVFLDIVLPGADGYEICRQIKHNRDTKRLPVIMLTSKSSPFDRIRGSLAGCSTYLTKPVDHATFHATVEKYLAAAKTQHSAAHGVPVFA